MDIPEDVIRAAAQKMWEMDDAAAFDGWDELASSYRAELIGVAEIAVVAGAEWALEEAADLVDNVLTRVPVTLSRGETSIANPPARKTKDIAAAIRALGKPQEES